MELICAGHPIGAARKGCGAHGRLRSTLREKMTSIKHMDVYIRYAHNIYIYIFFKSYIYLLEHYCLQPMPQTYMYIYIDILPKFEFISNFHVVHMRSIEISHPRRRGKNTMIRKALANGHEEHPEVDFSKMALEWGFV